MQVFKKAEITFGSAVLFLSGLLIYSCFKIDSIEGLFFHGDDPQNQNVKVVQKDTVKRLYIMNSDRENVDIKIASGLSTFDLDLKNYSNSIEHLEKIDIDLFLTQGEKKDHLVIKAEDGALDFEKKLFELEKVSLEAFSNSKLHEEKNLSALLKKIELDFLQYPFKIRAYELDSEIKNEF